MCGGGGLGGWEGGALSVDLLLLLFYCCFLCFCFVLFLFFKEAKTKETKSIPLKTAVNTVIYSQVL